MVLYNTLGNITNEYMGSQWALFMPSHPHATAHANGAGDSPEYAYSSSRAAESSARSIRLSSFVSNALMIIET